MRAADQLSEFIRESLGAGRSPETLRQALLQAGWSGTEIDEALAGWVNLPGLAPVPRPRPYVSAREALLYGLLFTALVMVCWHLAALGFNLVDRTLPDPAEGVWFGPTSDLRWSIAALITFAPLFYLLNARMVQAGAGDPARRRSLVRKWFASITMLIAALVLLGDLVMVIYTFLDGALGARYLAKTVLVAVLGGLVFLYYRDELDG